MSQNIILIIKENKKRKDLYNLIKPYLNNNNIKYHYLLSCAIIYNNIDCFKILLDNNYNINFQDEINGNFPLLYIFFDNHINKVKMCKILLNKTNIDVNLKNDRFITALMTAVYKNNDNTIKSLKLLLKKEELNVNIKNKLGATALIIACQQNNIKIVQLLLKRKNIDLNIKDNLDNSAFILAVSKNNIEIVKLLLEDERLNLNLPYYENDNDNDIMKIFLSYYKFNSISYNDEIHHNFIKYYENKNDLKNVIDLILESKQFIDFNFHNNYYENIIYYVCKYNDDYFLNKIINKINTYEDSIKQKTKIIEMIIYNGYNLDIIEKIPKKYLTIEQFGRYEILYKIIYNNICENNLKSNFFNQNVKKFVDMTITTIT